MKDTVMMAPALIYGLCGTPCKVEFVKNMICSLHRTHPGQEDEVIELAAAGLEANTLVDRGEIMLLNGQHVVDGLGDRLDGEHCVAVACIKQRRNYVNETRMCGRLLHAPIWKRCPSTVQMEMPNCSGST